MRELSITVNQAYKSFPSGFTEVLKGDLIILSGINGSGKSQLLDILRGQNGSNLQEPINSEIVLDTQQVKGNTVLFRSFKDNIAIPELTEASVQQLELSKRQAWDAYSHPGRLRNNPQLLSTHSRSANVLVSYLLNHFTEEEFTNGISQDKFFKNFPPGLIWRPDDVFSNFVGQVFFNHASKVYHAHAQASKTGLVFNPISVEPAPWSELNDLFEEMGFDYRFKSSYEIVGFEIDEQPRLYPVNEAGAIDTTQFRMLGDLSDGEKAIISFSFASLSGVVKEEKKLLLLDEFDCTLNPSLTEIFFKILHKYFISKGIVVVIATHSSATLSLAPEYALFYEVYKPKFGFPRILQVQKENYDELRKVNMKFYAKIEDQDSRIAEIQAEKNELETLIENLSKATASDKKLQIVTEGKNTRHIKRAIEILAPELEKEVLIIAGIENKTGDIQLKTAFEIISISDVKDKMLFVWDSDSVDKVSALSDTENFYKFVFERNDSNTKISRGIENLYPDEIFTDDVFETHSQKTPYGHTEITNLSKNELLGKIEESNDPNIFNGFSELIEKIRKLIE